MASGETTREQQNKMSQPDLDFPQQTCCNKEQKDKIFRSVYTWDVSNIYKVVVVAGGQEQNAQN